MSYWYIFHDGEKKGPYSKEQVTDLINNGEVSLHHMVWSPTTGGWIHLHQDPELAEANLTSPDEVANGSHVVHRQVVPSIATWSLALGLLSIPSLGLLSPAAIIVSIVALMKIGKEPAKYAGFARAVTGLAIGMSIGLFFLAAVLSGTTTTPSHPDESFRSALSTGSSRSHRATTFGELYAQKAVTMSADDRAALSYWLASEGLVDKPLDKYPAEAKKLNFELGLNE